MIPPVIKILAAFEPLLAALYWPCLSAKSLLADRLANQEGNYPRA